MKKAILFISYRLPFPPDRGDRIATWNYITHLSRIYDVNLFCVTHSPVMQKNLSVLRQTCRSVYVFYKPVWQSVLQVIIGLFSGRSLSCAYCYVDQLEEKIKSLSRNNKFEFVVVYSAHMFTHVINRKHLKKINFMSDVDSEKWRKMLTFASWWKRILYKIESRRLRVWELKSGSLADHTIFCTDLEKKIYCEMGGGGNVSVINNGVDTEFYQPNCAVIKQKAIIFTGVMDYFPNEDGIIYFLNDVFPLIQKLAPDTLFFIVGSNPTEKLKKMVKEKSHCLLTGYVEDVRPWMQKAMLSIVPLRIAMGIQNKILEALAMELPVVTTMEVRKSLTLDESVGVFAVEASRQMADIILKLLNDPQMCADIGRRGRGAVKLKYSWEQSFSKLDEIIEKATAGSY